MCGIAGIMNLDGERVDAAAVAAMIRTLRHRGPDANGVEVRDSVGLGHTRLSIIDAAGGAQPMSTADRRFHITYNGELFNYIELRAELEARGRVFLTRSDTEVVLQLYAQYGLDCLERMNGQWAFAVWDALERTLVLARDRLGIRPLFYTRAGRTLLFASEVKALLTHPEVPRRLDVRALDDLLTAWAPTSPRTMFEGIDEVPPGHTLRVGSGGSQVRAYWQPRYPVIANPAQASLRSDAAYVEELEALLDDATRLRLRADVPVGAYLSGGLDSSVIAGLAKRHLEQPVTTFSVTFDDAELDESRFQREMVERLGVDHRAVHCTHHDIARVFPQVVWHAEKPMVRAAPAPLLMLAQRVRDEGLKVVLTGEGADELLGGYDIFKEAKIRDFCARQPGSRWRPLLLARLYPYMPDLRSQSPEYLAAFFHTRKDDREDPFFSHLPRWRLTSHIKRFLSANVRAALAGRDWYAEQRSTLPAEFGQWSALARAQYLETTGLLPGYILSTQGDRMAMASSVEGRFPFLDHRLAEFANELPPRMKLRVLEEKYALRRMALDLVPDSIRSRTKQPYRAPDAASFFGAGRAREDYVEELLQPERIAEDDVFDPSAVTRLVTKAKKGRLASTRDNMALVAILSTQLLVHHFIRQPQVVRNV